jgi:hypothetical protein
MWRVGTHPEVAAAAAQGAKRNPDMVGRGLAKKERGERVEPETTAMAVGAAGAWSAISSTKRKTVIKTVARVAALTQVGIPRRRAAKLQAMRQVSRIHIR